MAALGSYLDEMLSRLLRGVNRVRAAFIGKHIGVRRKAWTVAVAISSNILFYYTLQMTLARRPERSGREEASIVSNVRA
jgi:hypothetical protein